MRYFRFFFLALIAVSLGVPQTSAQSLGATPLSVLISPQYPSPYDTITITPQSSLFDLAASTVTISVNGKVIQKGSGAQSASYTLGGVGELATITVSAGTPSGVRQKVVTVRPESVALITEPIATTHPFYEGGNLVASEGRVRLIALADLRTGAAAISPTQLVYIWKAGNQVLDAQSGIGRSTLTVLAPIRYRDVAITVTVSTPDGAVSAQSIITLSPTGPMMLIYRNDVLAGPNFDTALSNTFSMNGSEESFRVVPYYFPTAPTLAWSVNNAPSGSDPLITVRTTGDQSGTAVLSVTAKQEGSYQSASAMLNVMFGQNQESTNIFGL